MAIKTFCDFCEAEIISDPEGFVMKTVDKRNTIDTILNEQGRDAPTGYMEITQIGCKECKDKLKELLKKL